VPNLGLQLADAMTQAGLRVCRLDDPAETANGPIPYSLLARKENHPPVSVGVPGGRPPGRNAKRPRSSFADTTWTQEGKGHGRREKRAIRTAPAAGADWPAAQQVFRVHRDAGPTHGPWESKETALGITNLPVGLAGPQHIAAYARRHWAIENEEHDVRDVTFREDAQKTRTGSQPNAHAGIRNLVTGAFRKKGHANIAAARRYYSRDDQRILALYGYA
jgi:hypothetical protein